MDILLIGIIFSELISIILIVRLWLKTDYLIFKFLYSLVLLIPFVGPLLYAFAADTAPVLPKHKQGSGIRGEATHNWISSRDLLKKDIKSLEAGKKENSQNT